MKVGLYARVSTERQQERGTVASQLEALRAAARADGHEVIGEFVDDGYSGARLDRPALDRLRDAAEAGVLDGVLCLCVDRLARAYAYQVLILEELARFGVTVRFLEGPAPGDDPQARERGDLGFDVRRGLELEPRGVDVEPGAVARGPDAQRARHLPPQHRARDRGVGAAAQRRGRLL